MGYAQIIRAEEGAPTGLVITAIADKYILGFNRPVSIIGWGLICVSAAATVTVFAQLQLQTAIQGAAFSVVDGPATLLAAQTSLGAVLERSSLLKSRAPVAPNANLDPIDLKGGDLVKVNVSTAEAATTPGKYIAYILFIPKGSP